MIPAHRWLLVVLAVAGAESASARERLLFRKAAPPCVCPVAPAPVVEAPAPVRAEKLFTVSFEAVPWKDVLEWFAKETGLIFLSTDVPTGTLTLKSDKKYTRIELIDLFNEVLVQKNWIIICREQSFNIQPADLKIERRDLPHVKPEDLKLHANSEVVQVVITLKTGLIAEEVAPQAKKLLSVFGDVTTFGNNQLIIVDKAKNIKNICKYLTEDNTQGHDQFTYACKSVSASTAAVILAINLADRVTQVEVSVPWPTGVPDQRPVMQKERRYATVQITVDESSNRITITGPANKFVEAQSLLKEIEKGEKTLPIASPIPVCPMQHRSRLFARFR